VSWKRVLCTRRRRAKRLEWSGCGNVSRGREGTERNGGSVRGGGGGVEQALSSAGAGSGKKQGL